MVRLRRKWAVAKAKAQFSELIDRALAEGPQTITRNGRKAVVVVAVDEWERKAQAKGSLVDFFRTSPLKSAGIRVKRLRSAAREIEL
jgi:prevent-host-death family protein